MNCCVGPCNRGATVSVMFTTSPNPYPYCDWHAYRRGRMVWHPKVIRYIERNT